MERKIRRIGEGGRIQRPGSEEGHTGDWPGVAGGLSEQAQQGRQVEGPGKSEGLPRAASHILQVWSLSSYSSGCGQG